MTFWCENCNKTTEHPITKKVKENKVSYIILTCPYCFKFKDIFKEK